MPPPPSPDKTGSQCRKPPEARFVDGKTRTIVRNQLNPEAQFRAVQEGTLFECLAVSFQ